MSVDKVTSLSEYVDRVRSIRQFWGLPEYQELWFRCEDRKYQPALRPKLYRPPQTRAMKPIPDLLKIEHDLYDDFQRCGSQLADDEVEDEDWDWYFLMQHHGATTRLFDWSDGGLIALHFAVWPRENKGNYPSDAFVYVLEPYRLVEKLKALPELDSTKQQWKAFVEKRPSEQFSEDEWDRAYLPAKAEVLKELSVPNAPLLIDFPHITRRVAAQRSRLMLFGTDPSWLSEEFAKPDSTIKVIPIKAESVSRIRGELRDCGVTESVIFPDLDGLGERWLSAGKTEDESIS
jgi:hypothetical protein